MTPPPTITTRACEGRAEAMALGPHPQVVRIESRAAEHCGAAPFALNGQVENAAGIRECGFNAGECEALLHPMSIGAGGGDADAAIAVERGFAAARIGVSGLDFRIDDLERAGRL